MALIVQKFGGSSVADAQRIFHVAEIITKTYQQGNSVCVVLSAQGDTTDDLIEKVREYTNGRMAECVMEASGANSAIRATLDIASHAGRIALTGWPKQETPLPTDMITKKELDVRGARTSAGEFEEAVDIIYHDKVPVRALLTKVVSVDEVPAVLRDIEKNPGNYLKVNVLF